MKIQKFITLFGLLMLVLSACAPAAASSKSSSGAIPASLLNVNYDMVGATPPNRLTLYVHNDPTCVALGSAGNCFTILIPTKPNDPGARGSASYVKGQIVLHMEKVPYGPEIIGFTETFAVKDGNQTIVGVGCVDSSNATCGDYTGSTWKRAG